MAADVRLPLQREEGPGVRFTPLMVAVVAVVVVFLAIVVGGYVFDWGWTGFRGNTLWEWLQLLVLPLVLTGGGLWFNFHQSRESRAVADLQHQVELQIADDNQQEAALQAYLDHMSQLLLDKELKTSPPGSPIRELAQARTLTAVWHVGRFRKGILLKFLFETNLINKDNAIVELREADLSQARLSGIDLRGADLCGAHLHGADLRGARLGGAHLAEARLSQADLSGADLSGADLHGVNLTSANLQGTKLDAANMDGVYAADPETVAAIRQRLGELSAHAASARGPAQQAASGR